MKKETRNKPQIRAYDKVCKMVQSMSAQWLKNKNNRPMESVTISREDAEKAAIKNGERIAGVEVKIK